MNSSLQNRAYGSFVGLLAGDALGSLVEFRSKDSIAKQYPEAGGPAEIAAGGTWGTAAGQATDDGEMAFALARTLTAGKEYDPAAAGRAYVEWGASQPFDMGMTTRQGINAIALGLPAVSPSQANGALMRAAPIGIFYHGDTLAASAAGRIDARLTHPSEATVAANAGFCAAIAALVAGKAWPNAFTAAARAVRETGSKEIETALKEASLRRFPSQYDGASQGWVVIAFQNAFAHLTAGSSFGEALVETVAQGGDTDTNGAICGALLGARHGFDAIPGQWRDAVLNCNPGKGSPRPRPCVYWPSSALEVVDRMLGDA